MYTGLGDARSDYGLTNWSDAMRARVYAWLTPSQLQSVQAASIVYLPDPNVVSTSDGLIPATQAGYNALQAVHAQVSGGGPGGLKQAILASPELAGFWVSWDIVNAAKDAIRQGFFQGWDQLYASITTPGQPPTSGLEIPAGLTAAQLAPYLASLAKYFPEFANAYTAAAANTANIQAGQDELALQLSKMSAMAAGTITVNDDPGQGFTPFQIPAAFVDEGPVELPDGTIYVVAEGDASFDPSTRNVYIWHGPRWRPATVSHPDTGTVDPHNLAASAANRSGLNPWKLVALTNDLIQMPDPGTGSWYISGALGQTDVDGSPLWVPPVGYNGGYKLSQVVHEMYGMIPRVSWSETRDANGNVVPPTWIDVGAAGTLLPIAYAGDVAQPAPNYAAQPWTPPAFPGGQWTPPAAPGATTSPIPSPAPASSGGGGGVMVPNTSPSTQLTPVSVPSPVLLQPSASDPVIVSTLPPASQPARISSGFLLLLGAGAIYFATRKSR